MCAVEEIRDVILKTAEDDPVAQLELFRQGFKFCPVGSLACNFQSDIMPAAQQFLHHQ
ncbi:hypothetical protein D3C71_1676330 [compost metagenome]